jgi:hypothetical protein
VGYDVDVRRRINPQHEIAGAAGNMRDMGCEASAIRPQVAS